MKKIPFGNFLYEFHCPPEILKSATDNLNSMKSEIHWMDTIPGDSSSTKAGYMDKELTVAYYDETLFNWFQECIDEVVDDELPSAKQIICDSWLTKSAFGQSRLGSHVHSCSILSAVFYLTSHENTFTTFFPESYLNRTVHSFFCHYTRPNELMNNLESRKIISKSEAGKLMIFPANALHTISQHKDRNIRYTLAFNTFFDGKTPGWNQTGFLEIATKSSKDKYTEWFKNKIN